MIDQINSDYDYFIVGSDQVWNTFYDSFNNTYLLDFADDNKKIAFCVSMGVKEISSEYENSFKKYLPKFQGISVRENEMVNILNKYTKKDISVLCDPTIMIDIKEWKKIMKPPKKQIFKNYILTYFLGELLEKDRENILKISKEYKYNIVDISPYMISRIRKNNSDFYEIGPSEFLYLVFNASLVCTDSFHGFVFSCMAKKDIIIFKRTDKMNMLGRISGLMKELNCVDDYQYGKDILHTNKLEFDTFREEKTNQAKKFIKSCM